MKTHSASLAVVAVAALASSIVALTFARRCQRLSSEVERQRGELDALVRDREEELAGLGHRVRNALGTISINTSLLEAGEAADDDRGQHLSAIRRAVDRVNQALEGMLALN